MNERSRELIGHIDVNARVRELAEQSGCKIDRLGYGEGNLEKFAELIVRECAKVCSEQRDPANLNYKPSEQFAEAVKQHFGVY